MADIASSNVTYTELKKDISGDNHKEYTFSVAFGNGVLTYPAGGIPLLKAKLGCPNYIKYLDIYDSSSADGYVYKYDSVNNKVRIYQGDNNNAADAPLIELVSASATPAATTLYVMVKGW